MNKNELVRWLKSEKESALQAHRAAFESNRTKAKEQLYEACGANYLISELNELARREEELIKAFNGCNPEKMKMEPYYSHSYAESYLKITDPTYRLLGETYKSDRDKIIKNYDNVIRQVKILALKDATDWIVGLGLEIPEIVTKVQKNEIVVQIDLSYLRLNK